MSTNQKSNLSTRVTTIENKLEEVTMEISELKQVFSSGFDKLADSNEHLSRELAKVSDRMGDAIKHFEKAVPVGVVYRIFLLVFLLVGGIMALRTALTGGF